MRRMLVITAWSRAVAVAAATLLGVSLTLGVSRAAQKPTTGAEFDAATTGMNRAAVAAYVFNTYECHSCHVATKEGGTGFTARGNEARGEFVGCVNLLTTVNTALGTDPRAWTPDERRKHQNFTDFGCTFCHAPGSRGRMAFTEIGQKLGALHLGCVQVGEEVKTPRAK